MDDQRLRALLLDARLHLSPADCPPGWACLDHEQLERAAAGDLRAVNAHLGAHGGMLDMVVRPGAQVGRRPAELRVVYVHPAALAAPLADAA